MSHNVLVRYGAVPEVGRFVVSTGDIPQRDETVVVQTHRGTELGTVLERVATNRNNGDSESNTSGELLRHATVEDATHAEELRSDCESQYETWRQRIKDWNLKIELIDLEWTLNREKLVLYVLNDYGSDCTKLALQAAAAGLGIVQVQSVDAEGLVNLPLGGGGGGCGSGGGCGDGGCGA